MHNVFITQDFDWMRGGSPRLRRANRTLARLGFGARLRAPSSTGYMSSIELRINLYHLASQVLAYRVPGDFVEFGCFVGQSAILVAKVIAEESSGRTQHVYDAFEPLWNEPRPRERLEQNYRERGLPLPEIHAGWFSETIPSQLPAQIAFANLDCGFGGAPEKHAAILFDLLTHVYPRLSPGAVCSCVDYVNPELCNAEMPQNPGVKLGVDRFFADKPEKISVLYAAEYGHAYIRKI